MIPSKYDEWLQTAKSYRNMGDPEISHGLFDCLLCDILEEEQYGDIVKEFKSITRWYA